MVLSHKPDIYGFPGGIIQGAVKDGGAQHGNRDPPFCAFLPDLLLQGHLSRNVRPGFPGQGPCLKRSLFPFQAASPPRIDIHGADEDILCHVSRHIFQYPGNVPAFVGAEVYYAVIVIPHTPPQRYVFPVPCDLLCPKLRHRVGSPVQYCHIMLLCRQHDKDPAEKVAAPYD